MGDTAISFDNHVLGSFNLFGTDYVVSVTQSMVSTWIIMAFLIIFAIIVRIKLTKFKDVPTGFQNFVEIIVEFIHNLCVDNMGEKYAYFGGWFFGLFLFILCSNYIGLLNLRAPTSDIATTAAFGLITFFMIHFFGIIKSRKEYFKGYLGPNPYMAPFLLPLNIIGELAIPLSLSVRLFANILAGIVILGLVYGLLPWFLTIVFPVPLHLYFDLFSGGVQAYLFIMLSTMFIRAKLPD